MPDENENDIFGKFIASQLKKLPSTQAMLARDQINTTLTRCRLHYLSFGNTNFSFQTPPYNSSDSNKIRKHCINTTNIRGSILSTTEYQVNSNQQNQSNEIHYDDSDNLSDRILFAFYNV